VSILKSRRILLTQYSDSLKKRRLPRRNATRGGEEEREGEIGRETFETLPTVDRETPEPRSLSLILSPFFSLDSIVVLRRWNRGRRPVAKGSFKSKQRYVIREPGEFREIRCFPRGISLSCSATIAQLFLLLRAYGVIDFI